MSYHHPAYLSPAALQEISKIFIEAGFEVVSIQNGTTPKKHGTVDRLQLIDVSFRDCGTMHAASEWLDHEESAPRVMAHFPKLSDYQLILKCNDAASGRPAQIGKIWHPSHLQP